MLPKARAAPCPTRPSRAPALMLVHTLHISLEHVDISARFFHALTSTSLSNVLSLALIKRQVHISLRHAEKVRGKLCGRDPLRPQNDGLRRRKISQSLRAIKILEPNNFQLVPNISKDDSLKPQDLTRGDEDTFPDGLVPLKSEFSSAQVQAWLQSRDFASYGVIFANYTGVDMMRLSREDLKTLCGLSEGIRLYNSIHPECLAYKRTIYLLVDSDSLVYHPVYLYYLTSAEMCSKLIRLLGFSKTQPADFYLQGPNDIHVIVTDELVNHIKDESMFSVDVLQDTGGRTDRRYRFLLKPIASSQAPPG